MGGYKKIPLRETKLTHEINLIFDDPVPDSPELVDYHVLPRPVISNKIKNILEKIDIKGVQYVSVTIKSENGKIFNNYFLLHIFNLISCLDFENSSVDFDDDSATLNDLRSFMLDERKLLNIPLSKRLIFILREWPSVYICHKSIMESIFSVNPDRFMTYIIGLRFVSIEDWNDDIYFN